MLSQLRTLKVRKGALPCKQDPKEVVVNSVAEEVKEANKILVAVDNTVVKTIKETAISTWLQVASKSKSQIHM